MILLQKEKRAQVIILYFKGLNPQVNIDPALLLAYFQRIKGADTIHRMNHFVHRQEGLVSACFQPQIDEEGDKTVNANN